MDVAIEPYSNNVGFYRQPFFVAPRTTASRHAPDSVGKLDVDRVTVSPARVSVFEKATVAARLAVDGAPVEPVLLLFFSEDPAHGGEPFDAELVSHIRAGDVYVARVMFQPVTCGAHTIVVAAHAGTARPAIGTATLHVDCKSAERFVGRAENVTSGKPDGKVRVDGDVPFTGTFDLSAATLTITGVLQEVGGAELVKGNARDPLPAVRDAGVGIHHGVGDEPRVADLEHEARVDDRAIFLAEHVGERLLVLLRRSIKLVCERREDVGRRDRRHEDFFVAQARECGLQSLDVPLNDRKALSVALDTRVAFDT